MSRPPPGTVLRGRLAGRAEEAGNLATDEIAPGFAITRQALSGLLNGNAAGAPARAPRPAAACTTTPRRLVAREAAARRRSLDAKSPRSCQAQERGFVVGAARAGLAARGNVAGNGNERLQHLREREGRGAHAAQRGQRRGKEVLAAAHRDKRGEGSGLFDCTSPGGRPLVRHGAGMRLPDEGVDAGIRLGEAGGRWPTGFAQTRTGFGWSCRST